MDGNQGRSGKRETGRARTSNINTKEEETWVVELIPIEEDLEIHIIKNRGKEVEVHIAAIDEGCGVRIRTKMHVSNRQWCRQIREVGFKVGVNSVVLCFRINKVLGRGLSFTIGGYDRKLNTCQPSKFGCAATMG